MQINQKILMARAKEEEAKELFKSRNFESAFKAFHEAGQYYQQNEFHQEASYCFAQAANCWAEPMGRRPIQNAAHLNDVAAQESLKANNYAYARWLFKEAAILYEKEGDYENYSKCYVAAQDIQLKYLFKIFITGKKEQGFNQSSHPVSLKKRGVAIVRWVLGLLSKFLWGYGEKPFRIFFMVFLIIFSSALIYHFSGLLYHPQPLPKPILLNDCIYFSFVTFTTLGYGDIIPTGWIKIVACLEALSGIFIIPLFIVAMTRNFLKVYQPFSNK